MQALLMRAFSNATIDLHRRAARSRECRIPEWAIELALEHEPASPPPRKQVADVPVTALPIPAVNPRILAREAALAALRGGAGYKAAARVAAQHVGRIVDPKQIRRWVKKAGLLLTIGRPRRLTPEVLLPLVTDPRRLPTAWDGHRLVRGRLAAALGVSRMTLHRCIKTLSLASSRRAGETGVYFWMMNGSGQLTVPQGGRIRAVMSLRGLTVGHLAHKMTISETHMLRLLAGRFWSPQRLEQLRFALGDADLAWILGMDERLR
jgi:hypothetical protein